MNKRAWSPDELVEFEALVIEALDEPVVAHRIDRFLLGLDDAEQAQRFWAIDVAAGIRRDGIDRLLKNEQAQRKPRVPVTHDGQVIGRMPREVGKKVRDDDGKVEHHRGLFDFLTFAELRELLRDYSRNRDALDVDIFAVRKLMLQQRVPDAATPAEACDAIGTTVEEFLAAESS